jgi:hypothetical protein
LEDPNREDLSTKDKDTNSNSNSDSASKEVKQEDYRRYVLDKKIKSFDTLLDE